MDFEDALRSELSYITGLEDRVFPLSATEGVKAPYVVYASSEGIKDKSLDGYSDTKEVTCDIHVINNSYSGMKNLLQQVINRVITFQGRIIGGGVLVRDVEYANVDENYNEETLEYIGSFDITVRI
jgi:hypothetical protein